MIDTEEGGPRRGRRGASARRRSLRGGSGLVQLPWGQPILPYEPLRVLDEEGLERVHDASMRILEQIGVRFLLPEARRILKDAGAEVDAADGTVRMDRGLVMEAVARAPAELTLHARNPEHHVRIGARRVAFFSLASTPNVSDAERGRRPGDQADYRDLLRLAQALNCIHGLAGYPVEPTDLHPSVRHLEALRDCVLLTDKAFSAYSLGRERILDAIEIARLARGISHQRLEREPSLYTAVNTSSPLRVDGPMLHGVIEMARRNQAVAVTPFTLAGAMAPVTLAGALAQQNAEALAVMVLAQVVRPGAPVIYGGFTSNVDMRSGSPAFGTPEYVQAAFAGGQLARRYGLPYRSSNVSAANAVDAQAAYESMMSLWGAVLGGANLLMHSAGWMEGGLCASFEKTILDAELLQQMTRVLAPLAVDDPSLGLDAIREVGPGGHFFGAAHTRERFEHAFYAPILSDWRNYEAWAAAGSPDAFQRANGLYKELLAEYRPPPLDPSIREALDDFVERRKAAGGVPTDF